MTNFGVQRTIICKILQIDCQMTKVSFKFVNALQVYARKSGGTK